VNFQKCADVVQVARSGGIVHEALQFGRCIGSPVPLVRDAPCPPLWLPPENPHPSWHARPGAPPPPSRQSRLVLCRCAQTWRVLREFGRPGWTSLQRAVVDAGIIASGSAFVRLCSCAAFMSIPPVSSSGAWISYPLSADSALGHTCHPSNSRQHGIHCSNQRAGLRRYVIHWALE
jgi:hypothetical protein